ncbi:penicillin-binding protein 1A [Cytobacillus firmus]|uniref:Penicillin-binding protein 1A n=2 Tax=Cytobacillus TaxID=2675230 RepID=A0A366JME8_CYTFI|nr:MULTISPECIES: penicillin-binding protein 1A [Cytobacillus]RBP89022.1 penicillin-binding protein 1A [Cytobacillus firmus]TDX47125.1 penicillin-binding protein 1A [Cytobacillus oceanisediminis]
MTEKYQSREERRKQQSKPKKKGRKKGTGTFKRIFLILIALGIAGMLIGAGAFAFMVKDAPKLDEKLLKDPISSQIYDMEGEFITDVGSENRDYVAYEDIPKLVEDAFLATEDVRFYKHNGMDLIRLGGAVIANVTRGFGSEGASTITQQVVKNSFLNNEKTLSRKAQEAWLAFQLERKYTKQEIFEMYVNKIYMSEGHGVLTASKIFFDKELDELELHEAALLAGMPQSPNNYNPFDHPDKAEKRRNIVLSLMNQHGFITKEQMEAAQKVPVESTLVAEEKRETNESKYDSFIDVVLDEVEKKYPDLNPYSDGLKIYTTLDPDAQKHVEDILNTDAAVAYPDDEFQAGITLLDTKTGEIRAIGGGRNQEVKRGFNYAVDQKRHAGSTFKPIVDYGPAIEYLKWGTYHTIVDEPHTYSGGTKINNWDGKHMGPMSMREALARSRNIPALKTLQEVGTDKALEFTNKLGIPMEEMYESYSIGAYEVSSLQVAGAYSAFGNNGFYTEPHAIKQIEMRDGTKLDLKPESEVVMKDYTAFMISDMLKSVVKSSYGTGRQADVQGLPVAGKTGTTNYTDEQEQEWGIPGGAVPDAWFAGYTTNYTAAVWTGYQDRKNYIPAGDEQKIAQRLFSSLMAHVSEGKETEDFKVPNSVEEVAIEKGSNPAKRASQYTPKDQIIYEYAVKGNAPTQVSEKFDKLDSPSGLSANFDQETNEITLSWEYPEDAKGTQFEVTVSVNEGGDQQLSVTSEKGLKIANPQPGAVYTFKVTAFNGDQQSDPASVKVEIPDPSVIEEDETEGDGQDGTGGEEQEGQEGQNGEDGQDGNQDGDGSGNGEGEGEGEGSGDGTGNGEGAGNGEGNGEGSGDGDTGTGEGNGTGTGDTGDTGGTGGTGSGTPGSSGSGNESGT